MTQKQLSIPTKEQSEIQEFQFQDNPLRIVERDGELWFIAVDVCSVLGLGNTTNALKRLDDDEHALISIKGITKGNEMTNLVNESGFYSLVLSSRKPVAKEFKRHVTHEILPTIRKTGSYSVSQQVSDTNLLDTPSTVKDREPIRKLVNVWVGHARITFKDAWHMIHAQFGVSSIEEFTVSQVKDVTDWIQAHIDLALAPEPALTSYTPSAEYEAIEKEVTALYEQFSADTIMADLDIKNPNGTLGLIIDMKSHFAETLKVAASYEKILVRLKKFEADYLQFCLFRKMLAERK